MTRTPLRISFAGGGSDMRWFYRQYGGAVLSTAIDRHVEVLLIHRSCHGRRSASQSRWIRLAEPVPSENLRLRAALARFPRLPLRDVGSRSEAPTSAGLGSSSAFTVGLLNALHVMSGNSVGPEQLAREACELEIGACGQPIGVQDQYAVAFGGLNLLTFGTDDSVTVNPVRVAADTLAALESHLLMLFTGITRSASAVLTEQRASVQPDRSKHALLQRMTRLAYELRDELQAGRVASVGEILHENWVQKRALAASVSSNMIDEWYAVARRHGAAGGKVLGAGGGGCMLFFADPERHADIVRALPRLERVPFRFQSRGTLALPGTAFHQETTVGT